MYVDAFNTRVTAGLPEGEEIFYWRCTVNSVTWKNLWFILGLNIAKKEGFWENNNLKTIDKVNPKLENIKARKWRWI